MTRASIIIPSCNRLDLLQACVASIRQHTQDIPYELIVVDNGSRDGTAAWCLRERITFIAMSRNAGYAAACNRGMRVASGDVVVLLHNDTIVPPRWLSNLASALLSDSRLGMAGPISSGLSGKQQAPYSYADLAEFQRIASHINVSDPAKWSTAERVVSVCLAIRREVVERVGWLDEQFSPGYYEVDDYCLRVRLHGYGLLICQDVLIHHEGSASFKADPKAQEMLLARNYHLFLNKWNVDPLVFI